MNRRRWLTLLGSGCSIGVAGCVDSVPSAIGDSQDERTVSSGSTIEENLTTAGTADAEGPRLVVVQNATDEAHDVTVQIATVDATLVDERIQLEAAESQPTSMVYRLHDPGEYEGTVSIDGAERTETLVVTTDELTEQRLTMTSFRYDYEDELVVETRTQQAQVDGSS